MPRFLVRLTCANPNVTAEELGVEKLPEAPEIGRYMVNATTQAEAELVAIGKYIDAPNPAYAEMLDIYVLETHPAGIE